jgi:hypothetical protein
LGIFTESPLRESVSRLVALENVMLIESEHMREREGTRFSVLARGTALTSALEFYVCDHYRCASPSAAVAYLGIYAPHFILSLSLRL